MNVKNTAADINTLRLVYRNYWSKVPEDAWQRRTGAREQDWTLHETLAHLVSIASLFNRAVDAAVTGEANTGGPARREDLRDWNAEEIARLTAYAPQELIERFDAELAQAAERAAGLSPESYDARAFLHVYNRPARAIDFLDWQISHAGIVHGSQVTRPVRPTPLWQDFSAAMVQRSIDRFIRHFSYAYWQDYGPQDATILNFSINGAAGGDWHLIAAPDGGDWGRELAEDAAYTITFDSPSTFFGVFTVHIPMRAALQDGRMRIEGDSQRTLRLLRLFAASPPRQ